MAETSLKVGSMLTDLPFSCFREGLPLWEEVAESLWVLEEEGEWTLRLLPSQTDSVPAAQRVWSSLWDPAASCKAVRQTNAFLIPKYSGLLRVFKMNEYQVSVSIFVSQSCLSIG